MIKLTSSRRDLLYLGLLLVMVKLAVDWHMEKNANQQLTPPATSSYSVSALQENDILVDDIHNPKTQPEPQEIALLDEENPDEKERIDEPENLADELLSFHEADQHILKQIDLAKEQINEALAFFSYPKIEIAQLHSLKQQLVHLKRQYQYTSPAIALLGPIGSAGVVLKEQKLEKLVLKTVNAIGQIICQLDTNKHVGEFEPYDSVAVGLTANQTLLEQLKQTVA